MTAWLFTKEQRAQP